MHDLIIGVAEITLGLVIFHRVMPIMRVKSIGSALRVWALAMAVMVSGLTLTIAGLGYAVPGSLFVIGHAALIGCALLSTVRLRGAAVRSWAEAADILREAGK